MKAGAPVAVTDHSDLSPARQALAAHLKTVRQLGEDMNRQVAAPADRLRQERKIAEQQLADAEARFAAVGDQHRRKLREAAQKGDKIDLSPPADSAEAEVVLDRARRILASIGLAIADLEAETAKGTREREELHARTEQLLLDVFKEELSRLMDRLSQTALDYAAALLDFEAALEVGASHGRRYLPTNGAIAREWLNAMYQVRFAAGKLPDPQGQPMGPRQIDASGVPWAALIAQLALDASAER